MFKISASSMTKLLKIVPSVLGLAIFSVGVSQIPVNAQIIAEKEETFMAQVVDVAKNKILAEKAIAAVDLLKMEKYEEARKLLAPDVAKRLSSDEIATLWQNITRKSGEIKSYNTSRVVNTIDSNIVIIETTFAKGTKNVIVTYNKQGEILGLNVSGLGSVEDTSEDFIIALSKKDYNSARVPLHPFLKTELFAPQIQDKWEKLIARNGSFKQIKDTNIASGFGSENGNLVTITVEFEKGTEEILIVFDDNQLITGVNLVVE